MSKRGKMVGSFGAYCIFKTEAGYVVRHETLFSRRPRRKEDARTMCVGRRYTDVNTVPVATLDEANDVISAALISPAIATARQ